MLVHSCNHTVGLALLTKALFTWRKGDPPEGVTLLGKSIDNLCLHDVG